MKKKHIMLLVFAMLILISCSPNIQNSEKRFSQSNSIENGKSELCTTKLTALHNNSVGDRKLAQTSDGLYFLEACVSNQEVFTIRYIDFATKTITFLCSRPECEHNSESCNACVPSKYGGACGFIVNDRLYYIFGGNVTWQTSPRLISMNLDGSDHKTLTEFNSSVEISAPIITDVQNIYFIAKRFKGDKNGVKTSSELVTISLSSGDMKTVAGFDNDAIICGTYDNKILLKSPENYDTGGKGIYVPGSGNLYEIIEFNIDDNSQKTLMQIDDTSCIGEMINNKFYYVDTVTQRFYEKGLDGTDSFICDLPVLIPRSIYFYGTYDDKIVFDASTKENDIVKQNRFYIDLTKKTVTPILAQIPSSGKNIQILAQNKKDLIVISDYISTTIDAVDKDGVMKKFEYSEPQYSIIRKQDFFDGNIIYENVKNLDYTSFKQE